MKPNELTARRTFGTDTFGRALVENRYHAIQGKPSRDRLRAGRSKRECPSCLFCLNTCFTCLCARLFSQFAMNVCIKKRRSWLDSLSEIPGSSDRRINFQTRTTVGWPPACLRRPDSDQQSLGHVTHGHRNLRGHRKCYVVDSVGPVSVLLYLGDCIRNPYRKVCLVLKLRR